jgi:Lrp/AsnC family leucine-responsive transcriptional regulator
MPITGLSLEKLLDRTGRQLLRELQTNARLSFSELGRRVGLSTPAVVERMRRLEEAGLVTGYRAEVSPEKIGLPVTAFIRLFTTAKHYPRFLALAESLPEILECYHVTGGESFVVKVVTESLVHLESVIAQLSPFGETSTSVVLSAPIRKRILERPLPQSENGR